MLAQAAICMIDMSMGSIQTKVMTKQFTAPQLKTVNQSVTLAEELVCNFFKMSATQWLRHRYDVKTYSDLTRHEKVDGPFAQIVRYSCQKEGDSLCSSTYDFYKICLQDNAIVSAVKNSPGIALFPFVLYIIVHELIHIVRFAKFYQHFNALPEERNIEEERVHKMTREILSKHDIEGIQKVMQFYSHRKDELQQIY
jgi:hypothetical protein